MKPLSSIGAMVAMAAALASYAVPVFAAEEIASERVVKQFLSDWDARKLDAMMTSYADDAVVVLPGQPPFVGVDAIRPVMQNFVTDFSQAGATWDTYAITGVGDIVYILWRAQTPSTKFPFGSNTFVVEDGKIVYQTVAFDPAFMQAAAQ